jgi:hypothetical protein
MIFGFISLMRFRMISMRKFPGRIRFRYHFYYLSSGNPLSCPELLFGLAKTRAEDSSGLPAQAILLYIEAHGLRFPSILTSSSPLLPPFPDEVQEHNRENLLEHILLPFGSSLS